MKRYWPAVLCAVSMLGWMAMEARAQAQDAEAHVAAAKAVLSPHAENPQPWQTFASLFRTVCTPPRADARPLKVGPGEPDEKAKLVPTPRDKWYVPPVKVFDNLYFIGTQSESTWALTTSAGIILLNTNFPWVTPDLLNELKTFGLDPANIKYAIIVRSHSDQSWGINALKKMVPSARVVMSEKDWDLLAKDNTPADLKPVKDMVAKDGEKITLGDTTVAIYSTPTSTPGSISLIFPLKEGNQRHVAGMLGGDLMRLVQEGVQLYPDMQTEAKAYIPAVKRFKEIEDKAGVDAIIHIHSEDDNSLLKLDAVRSRKPGEPNPFISKDDVDRFTTVHIECAEAQLAWATSAALAGVRLTSRQVHQTGMGQPMADGQKKHTMPGEAKRSALRGICMRNQKSVSLATWLLVTLSFASSALANTHSQARAVRLSLVEGTVIARRPGSQKWARADLNMPIEQGVSIVTARHGVAEVQFENGSTLRLGELSRVDFIQMGFTPDRGYINHLKLAVGVTTVNVIPQRHDEYVLTASGASLVPHGKAEFRTDLSHGHLRVEVFKGRVQAADSSQSQPLGKSQVLACDYSVRANFHVTDNIQMDEWDRWVQMRDRQASLAAYSVPPPGMYEWESGLMPFGGDGTFPGFGEDGF